MRLGCAPLGYTFRQPQEGFGRAWKVSSENYDFGSACITILLCTYSGPLEISIRLKNLPLSGTLAWGFDFT
jgi:hypothetical protein